MSAEHTRVFLVNAFFHEYPDTRAAVAAAVLYGLITVIILGLTLKSRCAVRACCARTSGDANTRIARAALLGSKLQAYAWWHLGDSMHSWANGEAPPRMRP